MNASEHTLLPPRLSQRGLNHRAARTGNFLSTVNSHLQRSGCAFVAAILILSCPGGTRLAAASAATLPSERLSLDQGWRFHLGDIPVPVIRGHDNSYNSARSGNAEGAAAPDYDDGQWRVLDLPHDWALEGPFDPNENVSEAYRKRGVSWYRRYVRLDPADHGRALELQFDGISTHCTVWVNGTVVHRNWCGFTGFSIDLTPFATYGDEVNTIAIRVDANPSEGEWYQGAGIYRRTWLVKRSPVHIATDGLFAHPVKKEDGRWELPVEATLANSGKEIARVEVGVELLDPQGNVVVQGATAAAVKPLEQSVAALSLAVGAPKLWSLDEPALYTVRTTLKHLGATVDQLVIHCGFRTIRFDADQGFFLNDRPLKIKGTCNHEDHAGTGVAVPDSIFEFRVRKLKEMGSNAYRSAHHPQSPAVLDACDRLGMLVWDENRNFNSSPEYIRQLEWMVRRDRNHPSIILWSLFNEEPLQATEVGYEMVRRMYAAVKRLDPTRPVTGAMNGGLFAPVNAALALDVVSLNYQQESYDAVHQNHPMQALTSSEDTSAYMTRGEYTTDLERHVMDAYDTQNAPWGNLHRVSWKKIAARPFIAGCFIWTGFDYHGEPYPFEWPSASSCFGCLDLCGFPKSAFYLHQAAWIEHRPVLNLIPHWNWPGREGQPIKVLVFSNVKKVELFLNGKSLGVKSVEALDGGEWQVPYAPGKLEAIASEDGKAVARTAVETTGEPVGLKLSPDRDSLAGDGADAQPVTIAAVDVQGREVPTANLSVTFEISGPGAIIGLGNGDANCQEPEKGNQRSLYNGLAQVIVQTHRAAAGSIVLRGKAPGLNPAEVRITARAVPALPAVPPAGRNFKRTLPLPEWQMSSATTERPDPNQVLLESNVNSWPTLAEEPGQTFVSGTWRVYRTTFAPVFMLEKNGGQMLFPEISGSAEVWVNGALLAEKKESAVGALTVSLPPGKGARTVCLLVNSGGAVKAGLFQPVIVTPAK